MEKIILFVIILLINCGIFAQKNDALIAGHVVSGGEHLIGATVVVKGTNIGVITDKTGHFKISGLSEGKHLLKASYVGYKTRETEILAISGKTTEVNFNLVEDNLQLETVVVSANRDEISRKDAPVVVNVLSSKTLDATNSLNLADGFSFQPGMRLETNCQNCGFQQVRINGLEGPYSLVLIDSRPVFTALNSVYGIEQIPSNMIDRIEVVRGGGSALYGSNAIGGTINVLTKIPLSNSYQVASNFSFIDSKVMDNTITANASIVSDDLNSGIYLFGAFRDRQHYDSDGDGFSEIGKIDNHTIGFKSYYKPSSAGKISLEYHTLREFRRGGNKFDLQPHESDITEQVQHLINSGSVEYSYLTTYSNFSTYFSLQHIDRKSYYGTQHDPNAYGATTDFTSIAGIQYAKMLEKFIFSPATVTTGIEYQYDRLEDRTPGYNREINQEVKLAGAYFQSEWELDNFRYLIGARLDKHNLIGNAILSPRTTLLYKFTDEIQSRLTYAKGYRAPQAFDEDLHITAVGGEVILIRLAKDLKTESSNSISASLDLYPYIFNGQANILFEGFYTSLNDVFILNEIGTDSEGNKIVERQNGSGAEVYGVNCEAKFAPIKELNLQLGITFQRSLYLEPQQWSDDAGVSLTRQMPRTPDLYGYFTLSFSPSNKIDLSLSGVYTGQMYVPHFSGYIASDIMEKSKKFLELNFKAAYTFAFSGEQDVQVNAGIQNILNSYQDDFDKGVYRDAGYIYGPSRPRTLFVGFKIFN
jgi:outer membrane receptor for ferrienterochelin and colicins